MVGKHILEINMQDLPIRGMSSSNDIADGAFSPSTDAVNLIASPGVLYAPALAVDSDTDTRLTGNIIASSPDDSVYLGYERKMVTTDGKYYRYNGTKIPEAALRTDAVNTYTQGFTDMITFKGETYVTTKEKLVRWQEGITFNASFYSFGSITGGSNIYPHPAIVYENNAYYADGCLLLQQTSAGGTPTTVLTLSSDQIIIALGVDPGSGRMLISTSNSLNSSDTLGAINKLLWYDGNSAKLDKSVIIEDMITGFQPVGGVVYVGYGTSLGYINGSGISFLRKLNNVTLDNSLLPYKHRMTCINKTLYVVDGTQILAYGEVLQGRKIFYYCYKNNINSNKPISIFNVGNNKLGISFDTNKFYTFNVVSVATTNTMAFMTNKYNFPRPILIRKIYLDYADAIANNDDNRSLYYATESVAIGGVLLRVQGTTTGSGLKNSSGSTVNFMDNVIGFSPTKIRWLQFRYNTGTTNYGLRRILVEYDVVE